MRSLGWKAIHIEGLPTNYDKLIQNRPESLNINAALCEKEATVHFLNAGGVQESSGIYEFMSPTFRKNWHKAWNDENIQHAHAVDCLPLYEILHFFHVKHIDFWVLDIEGGEFAVLKSFFSVERTNKFIVTIDIIVIEFDGGDLDREKNIRLILEQNGYKSLRMPDDKQNVWFVHNRFKY